jgi:hypothetical protein
MSEDIELRRHVNQNIADVTIDFRACSEILDHTVSAAQGSMPHEAPE